MKYYYPKYGHPVDKQRVYIIKDDIPYYIVENGNIEITAKYYTGNMYPLDQEFKPSKESAALFITYLVNKELEEQ